MCHKCVALSLTPSLSQTADLTLTAPACWLPSPPPPLPLTLPLLLKNKACCCQVCRHLLPCTGQHQPQLGLLAPMPGSSSGSNVQGRNRRSSREVCQWQRQRLAHSSVRWYAAAYALRTNAVHVCVYTCVLHAVHQMAMLLVYVVAAACTVVITTTGVDHLLTTLPGAGAPRQPATHLSVSLMGSSFMAATKEAL